MKPKLSEIQVYTVVEVWRGMASRAKTFTSISAAQAYERRVRSRQNPIEDDVATFRGSLSLGHHLQHAKTSKRTLGL